MRHRHGYRQEDGLSKDMASWTIISLVGAEYGMYVKPLAELLKYDYMYDTSMYHLYKDLKIVYIKESA